MYIYIYVYIYIRFMLWTLSNKVFNAMKRGIIYMRVDINNNQLPLHIVSWVEPNLQIALRYNVYLY